VAPARTEETRGALVRCDRDSSEAAASRVLLASLYLDRRDHQGALAELSRGGATHVALFDRVIAKYEEILAAAPGDLPARVAFVEALRIGRRYDRVLSVGAKTLRLRDDETTA